jgi:hypothetical protein
MLTYQRPELLCTAAAAETADHLDCPQLLPGLLLASVKQLAAVLQPGGFLHQHSLQAYRIRLRGACSCAAH